MNNFQAVEDLNMNIGNPLIAVLNGLLNLFIYCYIANKPTEYYLRTGDRLCHVNWNKLPPKLQKFFIFMIQNAQQPKFYHGFHIIELNLETFTQVYHI